MNYILRLLQKLDSDTALEYTLSIKLFVYQRMWRVGDNNWRCKSGREG